MNEKNIIYQFLIKDNNMKNYKISKKTFAS